MSCSDECEYIDIGSSHYVLVTDFEDYDGNPLNSATGTWTLYASDDLETALSNGNLSVVSGNDYRGTISESQTEDLTPNKFYSVKVRITQSDIVLTKWLKREARLPN